ncbi:MAG: chorismate synthase [Candidatus Omnitrophica bacterium]|nr:chorismate synthase [Candidatus Omnitrophota bacterium]
MLRFLSGGESHGKGVTVILDGYPAGVSISIAKINKELSRRQVGYGRGVRMQIESDSVEILSGLKDNRTFGSPITLFIKNRDYTIDRLDTILAPRPGHADIAGGLKYNIKDLRLILERASARETVARVAAGSLCKQFLLDFGISVFSHVLSIGSVRVNSSKVSLEKIPYLAEKSELRCVSVSAEKKMKALINEAQKSGDSLGGVFEVIALEVPVGLGSYAQWDMRFDALVGAAILSIPAIKAVEIGDGVENSSKPGSKVQDEIYYKKISGFYRKTNRCGGVEGGITNGEPLVVKGYMKPIATLRRPLASVNIISKKVSKASKERADICAVPAAGVVAESMIAYIIMRSFLDKFGSDNLNDIKNNYKNYIKRLERY